MVTESVADTDRSLAEALGVHPNSVRKWRRHPEWHFTKPYPIAAVRRWRTETLQADRSASDRLGVEDEGDDPADGLPAKSQLERQRIAEQIRKLQLDREIRSGKRVPIEQHDGVVEGICVVFRSELLRLQETAPDKFPDPVLAERILTPMIHDILQRLSERKTVAQLEVKRNGRGS